MRDLDGGFLSRRKRNYNIIAKSILERANPKRLRKSTLVLLNWPRDKIKEIRQDWISWEYFVECSVMPYFIILPAPIIISVLTGRFVPFALFMISYGAMRYVYPKTYHAETFWGCIRGSAILFVAVSMIVLPLGISLLSSIPMGAMLGYGLYKLQDYFDTKRQVELLRTPERAGTRKYRSRRKFINELFEGNVTREVITERCAEKGVERWAKDTIIQIYVDKVKLKTVAKKSGYCEEHFNVLLDAQMDKLP